jgi:hypothetical protein
LRVFGSFKCGTPQRRARFAFLFQFCRCVHAGRIMFGSKRFRPTFPDAGARFSNTRSTIEISD